MSGPPPQPDPPKEWAIRAVGWQLIWFADGRMTVLVDMNSQNPPDLKRLTGLDRLMVRAMAEHLLRETEEI